MYNVCDSLASRYEIPLDAIKIDQSLVKLLWYEIWIYTIFISRARILVNKLKKFTIL